MASLCEFRPNRLTPLTGLKEVKKLEGYCFPTLRTVYVVHPVNLGSSTLPNPGFRKHRVDVILASHTSARVINQCEDFQCPKNNIVEDVVGTLINSHKIVSQVALWDPNR